MWYYLTFGMALGLTAGFSPGPLLSLVVSETLEHGFVAGIKVALAPIITDTPIVVLAVLISAQLAALNTLLGLVSIIGGCYLLFLAYHSTRRATRAGTQAESAPRSLSKGILTNALSPHPYLFWFSVGAPTVAKSSATGMAAPALFIGGFYLFLVGAKISLAILVEKSRTFLHGAAYLVALRILALTLVVFSVMLFIDGVRLLGLIEA